MGLVFISILMTLALPEDKIEALQTQFGKLINNLQTIVMELTRLLANLQIFQVSALRELYYQSIITQENLYGIPSKKTKCEGNILELKFDAVSSRNRPVCIRTQLLNPNIIFMETRINESKSGCSSGRKESQETKLLYICHTNSMVQSSMLYDPNENFS